MMDLYVPEKSQRFYADLFKLVILGLGLILIFISFQKWNTIRVNLNDLIKDKEVKEFGIKIGSSVSKSEFYFYLDNTRLIKQ